MGCAFLTIGSGVIAIVLVQVVYITFASRDLNGASGPAQPFHAGTAPPPGVIWIWRISYIPRLGWSTNSGFFRHPRGPSRDEQDEGQDRITGFINLNRENEAALRKPLDGFLLHMPSRTSRASGIVIPAGSPLTGHRVSIIFPSPTTIWGVCDNCSRHRISGMELR